MQNHSVLRLARGRPGFNMQAVHSEVWASAPQPPSQLRLHILRASWGCWWSEQGEGDTLACKELSPTKGKEKKQTALARGQNQGLK